MEGYAFAGIEGNGLGGEGQASALLLSLDQGLVEDCPAVCSVHLHIVGRHKIERAKAEPERKERHKKEQDRNELFGYEMVLFGFQRLLIAAGKGGQLVQILKKRSGKVRCPSIVSVRTWGLLPKIGAQGMKKS